MLGRREILTAALLGGAAIASPASACKAPAAKDRDGYTRAIDRLFSAWWARDFATFQSAFEYPGVAQPFDGRPLFDAHYAVSRSDRFRGELLFTGPSVIVQVVSPQGPDPRHGICGGYAVADLFLVRFFPGLQTPVVEEVRHLGGDLLAAAEWTTLANAPRT